jgi:hypothetical protein
LVSTNLISHRPNTLYAVGLDTSAVPKVGRLTRLELMVYGMNVAVRARRPIEWDAGAMKVTNLASANAYLTKEYRPGFGV